MADNITNNEDNFSSNGKDPSIDELQKIIIQQMEDEEKVTDESFEDVESVEIFEDGLEGEFGASLENEYYDISPVEKKYVVSINSDIVPYFEKIDPEERSELVNALIFEHIEREKKVPEEVRIKKLIKHSFVVIATIAIGVPMFFKMTNASIEATVNSYREVQTNFEKLYSQKGGVKRKDLTKMQNLQY